MCLNHKSFEPEWTSDQLKEMFRSDLCNTQRMLRDYRDVATLMWVLGQFDDPEEYERTGKALFEERSIPDTLKSSQDIAE